MISQVCPYFSHLSSSPQCIIINNSVDSNPWKSVLAADRGLGIVITYNFLNWLILKTWHTLNCSEVTPKKPRVHVWGKKHSEFPGPISYWTESQDWWHEANLILGINGIQVCITKIKIINGTLKNFPLHLAKKICWRSQRTVMDFMGVSTGTLEGH